jgi:putative sterol carrier protein
VQAVDVQPGSLATDEGEPNVIVVLSPETWTAIAEGRLAPYDALFQGRMRVGGDVELAKRVTQHLSDPAYPYVAPC